MATTPVFLPGKCHLRRAWWATVHGVTKSTTQCSKLKTKTNKNAADTSIFRSELQKLSDIHPGILRNSKSTALGTQGSKGHPPWFHLFMPTLASERILR